MKRFFVWISIACLFFLSFTSCGNGTAVKTQTSIDVVAKYLSTATGGADKENPIPLAVKIDLQNMLATDSGWKKLLGIINTAGKYVALDLSACTMPGTVFDPDPSFADGKNFIVSLILPVTAESIIEAQGARIPFQHFESLSGVPIVKNITSIGYGLFYRVQLDSIIIPDGFTSIGDFAFYQCGLTSVIISSSVTSIGRGAFSQNRLTNIVIPNSVNTIGSDAFSDNRLTDIIIPNSVTEIGADAFSNNPLISITISNNIGTSLSTSGFGSFHDFVRFYWDNDFQAGTYTRPDINSRIWTRQ